MCIRDRAWGTVTAEFSTFANYVDCMLAWGNKFTRQPYVDNVTACKRDPVTGHYDADSFITALWKSGYATDPAYVSKVIAVMKSRNLYRFNDMTSADLENGVGEIGTGTVSYTHLDVYKRQLYSNRTPGTSKRQALHKTG